MSYVEVCQKHGQHHTEICGECFDDLKEENTRLRKALNFIVNNASSWGLEAEEYVQRARAALKGRDN